MLVLLLVIAVMTVLAMMLITVVMMVLVLTLELVKLLVLVTMLSLVNILVPEAMLNLVSILMLALMPNLGLVVQRSFKFVNLELTPQGLRQLTKLWTNTLYFKRTKTAKKLKDLHGFLKELRSLE